MKIFTKLSHVNIKNTSHCQSDHGETLKNCEIMQSWHTILVIYEKLETVMASKQKTIPFYYKLQE